jgi:hypothetical protein
MPIHMKDLEKTHKDLLNSLNDKITIIILNFIP